MINKGQPLVEVFGFSTDDFSKIAISHRDGCLCPYNNGVPKCTKDKKDSPLGVCTLNHNGVPTIICPIRFREDWRILKDATEFFFKGAKRTRALKEVRLKMKNGQSAGNIDVVLVSHDELGRVIDFGAIEIQAVYVSGNIRNPFEAYMKNPQKNYKMDWTSEAHYPRADFLSSSRKRLVPQLMYKGRILQDWKKKQAVVIDKPFFETLPELPECSANKADILWLVYDLKFNKAKKKYELHLYKKVYTGYDSSLKTITKPEIGPESDFVSVLEKKLASELKIKDDKSIVSNKNIELGF